MFQSNSRYYPMTSYTVTMTNGNVVTATRLPLPSSAPMVGFHRRLNGQRLDLIANFYLTDPTAFWRLCDVNNSVSPDALAYRALIGIPGKAT